MTEHHLEFLRLKGGCTDSSESIHVKMPRCWKSHCYTAMFLLQIHTMKIAIFSAVAVLAVVGIAFAQDFNNFNNDDGFNNFNNDDGDDGWGRGGGWGAGRGIGSVGGVSSSWGSSWGGAGYGGMGYGAGYGSGYGAGYGAGIGKAVSYVPLPVAGKGQGSGILGSIRKYLYLVFVRLIHVPNFC